MSSPAVSFRGASLGYGGTVVVRGVSLDVARGEVVGLVGPNGAGKTTCLRGVSGSAAVLEGTVLLQGRPVREYSAREMARVVGVLPQGVRADVPFSAREFVEMGRHARMTRFAGPGPRDDSIVEDVMVRTDTERFADEPVTILSGGDLQRLALAQALAQEPDVLLLDEPTSHLDLNHRLQILDLVGGLAGDGLAVLGVFHDLDLAARYAGRIAVLHHGEIVHDGTPKEVLRPDLLREVFGVRAVVGTDAATGSVSVSPLLREEDVALSRDGRVLVVGGSGQGAWILRQLVLDGYAVSLAAVSEGDTDHSVAVVLGIERVDLEPFGGMDAAAEEAVAASARSVDVIVVTRTPFGSSNLGNLRAAVSAGVSLVLVGTMDQTRDFCGGEATRLWDEALVAGAVRVDDDEEALVAVERVIGR